MSHTAHEIVAALGGRWIERSESGTAKCPAHDDERPSLSVAVGDDHDVVFHCHAGCPPDTVIAELSRLHLWPTEPRPRTSKSDKPSETRSMESWVAPIPEGAPPVPQSHPKLGAPTQSWWYRDSEGRPLFVVSRYLVNGKKEIRQYTLWSGGEGSSWKCKHGPSPRPLYGLDRLHRKPSAPALVVEGELCAEAAGEAVKGFVAMTWSGGSSNVTSSDWSVLSGRDVVIWPDADQPGIAAADRVVELLDEIGVSSVRVVKPPPNVPKGWDVADAVSGSEWSTDRIVALIGTAESRSSTTDDREALIERAVAKVTNEGDVGFFGDDELLHEIQRLRHEHPARFEILRARLKEAGLKTGRFDRVVKELGKRARSGSPGSTSDSPYVARDGAIYLVAPGRGDIATTELSNFDARIVEEIVVDDGVDQQKRFVIEGKTRNGRHLPRVEVPADEFASMRWVIEHWGVSAVIAAGPSLKDHLRAAIQSLSSPEHKVVFGHLGWKKIDDRNVFIHNEGAIGTDGTVGTVTVTVPPSLSRYILTDVGGDDIAGCVSASLGLLDGFGPDRIIIPALTSVFRAVLGNADFSVFLVGGTGIYKSELAALIQQHFGNEMDARRLPESWSSTENALEMIAFQAKDCVLVIDEFKPVGNAHDVNRLHRVADRVLRAQGNGSGRTRMREDSTLRISKPPRGLVLATGEDLPRGQSLRARMLAIRIAPGDLATNRLTQLQETARAGKFSKALSAYLTWLAPQLEAVRADFEKRWTQLRNDWRGAGHHARVSSIVAQLHASFEVYLRFAMEIGAVDDRRSQELLQRSQFALLSLTDEQDAHQSDDEPARRFARLLRGALVSGRAHVLGIDGGLPENPTPWGWAVRQADGPLIARGECIGWLDGDNLYLDPEVSHAVAQNLAQAQNETFVVTAGTVRHHLRDRDCIVSCDTKRQRLTIRKTIASLRREVLHLRRQYLIGEVTVPTVPTVPGQLTATEEPTPDDDFEEGDA